MIDQRRGGMNEIDQHAELNAHQQSGEGDADNGDAETDAVMDEIAPGDQPGQPRPPEDAPGLRPKAKVETERVIR
jgi:hypothetical protein